jgi:hypothetical protein
VDSVLCTSRIAPLFSFYICGPLSQLNVQSRVQEGEQLAQRKNYTELTNVPKGGTRWHATRAHSECSNTTHECRKNWNGKTLEWSFKQQYSIHLPRMIHGPSSKWLFATQTTRNLSQTLFINLDVTIHSLWPINRHTFTMITEFVKKYIVVPENATFSYQRASLRLGQLYCLFVPMSKRTWCIFSLLILLMQNEFNKSHVLY